MLTTLHTAPESSPPRCTRVMSAVSAAPAWRRCRPGDNPRVSGIPPGGQPGPPGPRSSSGPRESWTGPRSRPTRRLSPGHWGRTIGDNETWSLGIRSPLLHCCWGRGTREHRRCGPQGSHPSHWRL